jgi:large subunit ribosomal protein L23
MGILDRITKKSAADKKPAKEVKKVSGPGAKKEVKSTEIATSKKEEKKAVAKKSTTALFAYDVVRAPVSTEKCDRGQMHGKYTFFVAPNANKVLIAQAIKELYGVKPLSVRIMNIRGKKVRLGRLQGIRKNRKKAIVTLKSGDMINITE